VKIATLSVIPEKDSLAEALRIMQESGHSAVVVRRLSEFSIVTASDILAQLRQERPPLTMKSVGLTRQHQMAAALAGVGAGLAAPDAHLALGAAVSAGESDQILLEVGTDNATVGTEDPLLASCFEAALVLCRCRTHPETHVWQPGELIDPTKCNLDESHVDCK
jgi:hypothetical protein